MLKGLRARRYGTFPTARVFTTPHARDSASRRLFRIVGVPIMRFPPFVSGAITATTLAASLLATTGARAPSRSVAAEPGRINGTVVLSHALASRRRPAFRIYAEPGPGSTPPARPAADLKGEYQNVVVYLELDPEKMLATQTRALPRP